MPVVPAIRRAKKLAIHFGHGADTRVGAMLGRQNLNASVVNQRNLPTGTIGCLGDAALPEQGDLCFFTGLPIHGPDVDGLVDADSAARLFSLYDGAFTGVYWDAERGRLVVATDCLGMQPLYMRHAAGELTLVSETKALAGEPDLSAWGAFLSLGHPIGARSLMDGLRRVPPASILTYDCVEDRITIGSYWQWPEPSDAWQCYGFSEALEADIQAYSAFGNPGTLLLSGGFDSRLLLLLLQRAGVPADALTIAHEDEHRDADGRFAQAVAALVGMRWRLSRPPTNFFSSRAYLDYLRASDVGYPSLGLFISKVASQIDSTAVWDGLAPGFVFMPLHQPDGGFDAFRQHEVRGRDSAIWRAARAIFKPEAVAAMSEGFSEDLQAETARLPKDMHGLERFVIENRSRNRASMNPLKVYANRCDAFTPGLSKDFMTHAAAIPFREKLQGRFYRDLLARLDKRVLATPFSSGGDLMTGTRFSPAYLREHLRITFTRLRSHHPSLFPGVQPEWPERSLFLGAHLFEEDQWLNPDAWQQLKDLNATNYEAWKLLFHWKAWQWLHQNRLEELLVTR